MGLSHLPHIKNVTAGSNKYDPVHSSIFEVYITVPEAIASAVPEADCTLLSEQITKVSGLSALQKMPESASQKFYGVDVSYLKPVLSETRAKFTIEFNLNLRNVTDNYVLKAFKEWGRLSYDLATGSRTLKSSYCADTFRIAQANRDGSVWRAFVFHDVMIEKIDGLNDLEYTNGDALKITVSFVSDYWDEDMA